MQRVNIKLNRKKARICERAHHFCKAQNKHASVVQSLLLTFSQIFLFLLASNYHFYLFISIISGEGHNRKMMTTATAKLEMTSQRTTPPLTESLSWNYTQETTGNYCKCHSAIFTKKSVAIRCFTYRKLYM